jgi:glutathione synthase/RimK-type ligase-like ATP-grasp enzyme
MRIALVTATNMPKPDSELDVLTEALEIKGLTPKILAWDAADEPWREYDLVLIKSPWDYFGRHEEFLNWVTTVSQQTRLHNAAEIIRWNVDKRYLLDLESAQVPIIPTVYVAAREKNLEKVLNNFGDGEIVIKPAVSIGANGALRVRASDQAALRHLSSLVQDGNVLVQPFIESVLDEGEVSLLYFNGNYSHAVRKRARKGDYRVQDHHGGSVEPHTPTGIEKEVARSALNVAPKVPLLARVDLVSIAGLPHIIELELIEPAMFLESDADACSRLADAVIARINSV